MISLLNSINDNILSLTGVLKYKGLLGEEEGKERGKANYDNEKATDFTYSSLD